MAQKKNIAYLNDLEGMATTPDGAVQGNIAVFGENGDLHDSGKKPSDFVEGSDIDSAVEEAASDIWNAVKAYTR